VYMSGTAPFGEGSKRRRFRNACLSLCLMQTRAKNDAVIASCVGRPQGAQVRHGARPLFSYLDISTAKSGPSADPETIELFRLASCERHERGLRRLFGDRAAEEEQRKGEGDKAASSVPHSTGPRSTQSNDKRRRTLRIHPLLPPPPSRSGKFGSRDRTR